MNAVRKEAKVTVYNKLVRDKIPDRIRAQGGQPKTHIAGDDEFRRLLRRKLDEEVQEFIAAPTDQAQSEELADVLEVIWALAASLHIRPFELEGLRAEKLASHGGFSERIILEEA